jgi:hypothetical protein
MACARRLYSSMTATILRFHYNARIRDNIARTQPRWAPAGIDRKTACSADVKDCDCMPDYSRRRASDRGTYNRYKHDEWEGDRQGWLMVGRGLRVLDGRTLSPQTTWRMRRRTRGSPDRAMKRQINRQWIY